MAIHEGSLAALGLDLKWLLKESKVLIRQRVIKTSSVFLPPPEEEAMLDSADKNAEVNSDCRSTDPSELMHHLETKGRNKWGHRQNTFVYRPCSTLHRVISA